MVDVAAKPSASIAWPIFALALALALASLARPAAAAPAAPKAAAEPAHVTVHLRPGDATLVIDGVPQPPVAGDRPLRLPPGPHVFEAHHPDCASAWRRVELVSGRNNEVITIRLVAQPPPSSVATADDSASDDEQGIEPPWGAWLDPNGPYVVANGGFIGALRSPAELDTDDGVQGGGTVGMRFGYRLAERLGVELLGQYAHLVISGTVRDTPDLKYELVSFRMGAGLRLMVPGDTDVRFVGTFAGGAVYDNIDWSRTLPDSYLEDADGFDGFGQVDLGIELEVQKFLFELLVELALQSTAALEVPSKGESAFQDGVLPVMGAILGIGYGIW